MSADPRRRPAPVSAAATPPPPPPPPPAEAQPDSVTQGLDGADDQNTSQKDIKTEDSFKLRFCTVCASNNNRYVLCAMLMPTTITVSCKKPLSLMLYISLCVNVYTWPKFKAHGLSSRVSCLVIPSRHHHRHDSHHAVLIPGTQINGSPSASCRQ
jgi:hypothetical protein